jgi:hypothetical protein
VATVASSDYFVQLVCAFRWNPALKFFVCKEAFFLLHRRLPVCRALSTPVAALPAQDLDAKSQELLNTKVSCLMHLDYRVHNFLEGTGLGLP